MDRIDAVRAFNRFYTRELGLLGRSYLGSGLGVTEVRILYELAHGRAPTARALSERLALDEGYLSRVLAGFVRRGWLQRVPDGHDARQRILLTTEAGRVALAPLERASRAQISVRLADLTPERLTKLGQGMTAVRQALCDPDLSEEVLEFADLSPGDPGWVVSRHGALYAQEEGYDTRFEALVARIVADFLETRASGTDMAWIARSGEDRLGCIFCVREDVETARLRLFLVEPCARGRGIGRRLLDEAIAFARAAGYRRMVLWTHESHRAACALYAIAGFRLIASAPAMAFGQAVVDQTWEVAL